MFLLRFLGYAKDLQKTAAEARIQQVVFDGPYIAPNTGPTYDASPDGKRFLMIKAAQPPGAACAHVFLASQV